MKEIRDGYKETEIGVLPEDWEVVKIEGCTSEIIGGGTPARSNPEFYNGDIPWITVKDLDNKFYKSDAIEYITEEAVKRCSTNLIAKESVIIATRMGLGRGFINTKPVAINQDMKALILKNKIDTRYFLFWYLSQAHIIENLGTGTTVKGIRLETLKALQLPLPPLPEQQHIAEILTNTDAHLEKLDTIIADTQLLKKGMMQKLLTRGIGHTEFKDTEIGPLPKAWEVVKINECVKNIIGGGTPSRSNPEFYCGDIPWITVKDLDKKFYKDDAIEYITEEAIKNCATNLIQENAVIIATRMGLGRGFINTKPVAINQDMKALILNEFVDQRYFLFWYLSNAALIEKLGTGTTVKGIRLETLKDLVLPLPPLPEQHRIAEILSAIDDRIQLYEKEKADFTELKKGLMEQLLTGKIRVKHQV